MLPHIDLAFPIQGSRLAVDHGYSLYAAISRAIPEMHEAEVGIHPVFGQVLRTEREMRLTHWSRVTIRLEHSLVAKVLKLAGKRLDVDGYVLRLGVPEVSLIRSSPMCKSRLVTIKGYQEAESFLEAVQRQLAQLNVIGNPHLIKRAIPKPDGTQWIKRTLRIKEKEIVGYAVQIEGLSDEDSIKLQVIGIGGRRKMGCGVFVPLGGG